MGGCLQNVVLDKQHPKHFKIRQTKPLDPSFFVLEIKIKKVSSNFKLLNHLIRIRLQNVWSVCIYSYKISPLLNWLTKFPNPFSMRYFVNQFEWGEIL